MQHLTIKAAATATDRGHFTAIAATWGLDRQGDQIRRGAFATTIKNWRESHKRLPLHWNHSGEAANVIGWVDPASMREADEGLYVRGQLDLEESATAREAWRSMKNNSVSLSFGYVVTKSKDRDDGVRELLGIDLFEISIVPHPANADTRFVSLKAASAADVADADWQAHKAATAKADKAHEEAQRKREQQERGEKLVEEITAKARFEEAKAARRARPIKVKTFNV